MKRVYMAIPDQFGYVAGYYHYAFYLSKEGYNVSILSVDKGLDKIAEIENVTVNYIRLNESNRLISIIQYIYCVKKWLKQIPKDSTVILKEAPFISLSKICTNKQLNYFLDIRTGAITDSTLKLYILNKLIQFDSLFFNKIFILSVKLAKMLNINISKTIFLPLGSDSYSLSNKDYNSCFNLIYIGTLDKRHITETIIGFEQFYRRNKDCVNISYTIIGYGENTEITSLKDTISDLNLTDIVHYEGRKTYAELKPYLEQATIGVCYIPITKYYDNQPSTKLFEYILSGLICIATKTSSNIDYITKDNGILCYDNPESFNSALEYVYNNKNSYKSDIVRNSLKAYQWNKIVKDIIIPEVGRKK